MRIFSFLKIVVMLMVGICVLGISPVQAAMHSVWKPLVQRLSAEGFSARDVERLFASMPAEISSRPMGTKILELYRVKYIPRDTGKVKMWPKYYPGVATQASAERCRVFLQTHAGTFSRTEARYGTPKSILAALIFVESRLGTSFGKGNALHALASMSLSKRPEQLSADWYQKMPGYEPRLPWIRETMEKRSEWAYKELRALVQYLLENGNDPAHMPGSVYGAIGYGQFMPSNIVHYAADGDADGRIDLFNPADGIASVASFLAKHGWKKGVTREKQHALLKRYNKSTTYANTIMALASVIDGGPVPPANQYITSDGRTITKGASASGTATARAGAAKAVKQEGKKGIPSKAPKTTQPAVRKTPPTAQPVGRPVRPVPQGRIVLP